MQEVNYYNHWTFLRVYFHIVIIYTVGFCIYKFVFITTFRYKKFKKSKLNVNTKFKNIFLSNVFKLIKFYFKLFNKVINKNLY